MSTAYKTDAANPAGPPMVATKLDVPEPPADRVSRPGLVAALRGASDARLMLVSAPAGAGKTTVLASWRADPAERRPFAWLSLDERDNDPVRFWGYVLSALRTVAPGLDAAVDAALRLAGVDLTELALPLLVNALNALPQPVVLVLDDYHLIANADVHQSMQFLIDHLPRTVQVAVAGRSDPPLALARLRANAELVEVRVEDLRLSTAEADALLNGSLRLNLAPEQVRVLRQRTEGWAAGLQLVGLSLRGRENRGGYIASFAGDDRRIVDYLVAEVLDRQSPHTREFLLRTSILESLSGPLCDALLERGDSARRLVELERANLFLVSLDERRQWYRYHQLFGDLLAHELKLVRPEEIVPLHRRAGEWYQREGMVAEAVAHALAAGDHAQAAELIAANWLRLLDRGELATVEAWTRALPAEVAASDSLLRLTRAWTLVALGRPGEVETELQAAERGTVPGPLGYGWHSVECSAAIIRTVARVMLGDVAAAAQSAALAAELESDTEPPRRPYVSNVVGLVAFWSGAADDAARAFEKTLAPTAGSIGYEPGQIPALGYSAVIFAERGELDEAERRVAAARDLAERQALSEWWFSVMIYYAAGVLARARGELLPARAEIEHGLTIARRIADRPQIVYGLLSLARIAQETGARSEARELLARARRQLAACPDPGFLRDMVGADTGELVSAPRAADGADELSERELAVLLLLSSQLSLREIGDELYVSLNTVKTHTRNIYAKLRVGSRERAVRRGRELGLLKRSGLAQP